MGWGSNNKIAKYEQLCVGGQNEGQDIAILGQTQSSSQLVTVSQLSCTLDLIQRCIHEMFWSTIISL